MSSKCVFSGRFQGGITVIYCSWARVSPPKTFAVVSHPLWIKSDLEDDLCPVCFSPFYEPRKKSVYIAASRHDETCTTLTYSKKLPVELVRSAKSQKLRFWGGLE